MNEDNVKALVEKTVKRYRRLDYAFNNAGVVEDPASFTNKTSSIFDKIMAINVKRLAFMYFSNDQYEL